MTLIDLNDPDPVCLPCPHLRSVRAHAGAVVRVLCDNPDCEKRKETKP